jgi:hypothetical protein
LDTLLCKPQAEAKRIVVCMLGFICLRIVEKLFWVSKPKGAHPHAGKLGEENKATIVPPV